MHRCGDADVLERLSLGEPGQSRGGLPLDEAMCSTNAGDAAGAKRPARRHPA